MAKKHELNGDYWLIIMKMKYDLKIVRWLKNIRNGDLLTNYLEDEIELKMIRWLKNMNWMVIYWLIIIKMKYDLKMYKLKYILHMIDAWKSSPRQIYV